MNDNLPKIFQDICAAFGMTAKTNEKTDNNDREDLHEL